MSGLFSSFKTKFSTYCIQSFSITKCSRLFQKAALFSRNKSIASLQIAVLLHNVVLHNLLSVSCHLKSILNCFGYIFLRLHILPGSGAAARRESAELLQPLACKHAGSALTSVASHFPQDASHVHVRTCNEDETHSHFSASWLVHTMKKTAHVKIMKIPFSSSWTESSL